MLAHLELMAIGRKPKGETREEYHWRINASLKCMQERYPGPHTIEEIADFCGWDYRRVDGTIKTAMKKMKKKLPSDIMELFK